MEEVKLKYTLKMKIITCLFVGTIFVSFVYSVDVNRVLSQGIDYIGYNNNCEESDFLDSPWTYECASSSTCIRKKANEGEVRTTLETCNMICSPFQLWPKPKSLQVNEKCDSTFNKNQVIIQLNALDEVKKDLKAATKIFINNLPEVDESWINDVDITNFKIDINVAGKETKQKISTNESYSLIVIKEDSSIFANISAPTYFGARHGLETLSQLIWLDTNIHKLKIIHDVQIYDKPKFSHRGLMVDTARNYFPIEKLKKVVDGMAASKLNVFHLHLTDSVSFPIVLPNNVIFAKYGAYSPDMVYTPQDVRGLIEYARIRGIRVVLEIDAPSHTNEGWNQRAENLIVCGKDNVFNGHLNPENSETLSILESVYKDLLELGSDNDMFHIGGDEVNLTCWGEVTSRKARSDLFSYWVNFTNQMLDRVKSANNDKLPTHIVLWSSPLTNSYLGNLKYPENVVVQYWYGSVDPILKSGHKVIFSTVGRWYLDCGFGPWRPSMINGVCDPYTHWQTFYKYRPWNEYFTYANQFLGGEACLWTEEVDVDSLETRIWPRAAALAERLWSDPASYDTRDVYTRLDTHRTRLIERGIKASAMWPKWCSRNPGKC